MCSMKLDMSVLCVQKSMCPCFQTDIHIQIRMYSMKLDMSVLCVQKSMCPWFQTDIHIQIRMWSMKLEMSVLCVQKSMGPWFQTDIHTILLVYRSPNEVPIFQLVLAPIVLLYLVSQPFQLTDCHENSCVLHGNFPNYPLAFCCSWDGLKRQPF